MEDVDAVLDELVGRDLLGVFALLDEAALDAVLDVGELDAAVADAAASEEGEVEGVLADGGRHLDAFALQEAGVAVDVADDLHFRRLLRVGVDEVADG